MNNITLAFTLIVFPMLFTDCGFNDFDDNNIKINQDQYILHYKETAQINSITKATNIVYTSQSEYVASVSESGVITAGRVGEANIYLSNMGTTTHVTVKVEPVHNIYPEPIHDIDFGVSKESVKSTFGNNPTEEHETALVYRDYHKDYDYVFLFEDEDLAAMGVLIPTPSLPDNFTDFLLERYLLVAFQDGESTFLNQHRDLGISMAPSKDSSEIMVVYFPFESAARSSSPNLNDHIGSL